MLHEYPSRAVAPGDMSYCLRLVRLLNIRELHIYAYRTVLEHLPLISPLKGADKMVYSIFHLDGSKNCTDCSFKFNKNIIKNILIQCKNCPCPERNSFHKDFKGF